MMRAMETALELVDMTSLNADLSHSCEGELRLGATVPPHRARRRPAPLGVRGRGGAGFPAIHDELWKSFHRVNETKFSNTQPGHLGREPPGCCSRVLFTRVRRLPREPHGDPEPDPRLHDGRWGTAPDPPRRAPQHPCGLQHPPHPRDMGSPGQHPALPQRGVARRMGWQARALGQGHENLARRAWSLLPATGCSSSRRPRTPSTGTRMVSTCPTGNRAPVAGDVLLHRGVRSSPAFHELPGPPRRRPS